TRRPESGRTVVRRANLQHAGACLRGAAGQPRAEPAVSGSALRRAGSLVSRETKSPGSDAGAFHSGGRARHTHILSSFRALPSAISARSASLIGAALSHLVPSA